MTTFNTTLSQSQLTAILTILSGKPATYAQFSALLKQGMPNTYTASWLTRPARQFNLDDVLAWFASPRERKIPSRHGVRTEVRPGVVLDEAKIWEALAQVLEPKKVTPVFPELASDGVPEQIEPHAEEEEAPTVFRFNEDLYANDSNDGNEVNQEGQPIEAQDEY